MNMTDPHAGHNMAHNMNHGAMDHGSMNNGSMNHGSMDHSNMNQDSGIDHSVMDHHAMDHHAMDNGDTHGGVDHSMMNHGMKMYFHFSNEATILFSGWTTNTAAQMFGSCMAVLIFAALYESLKSCRERLLQKSQSERNRDYIRPVPSDDIQVAIAGKTSCSTASQMLNAAHFIQTLLHVLQVVLSYFLMLIFMTYNVWLCSSVAVGAGVGYFLFGWRRGHVADRNEHCH